MSILGKSTGIFLLDSSDKCVGSYLSKPDVMEILGVSDMALNNLKWKRVDGLEVIDERDLQKAWYASQIAGAPAPRVGRSKRSLDEIILSRIIVRTYPDAIVEPQVAWGRKSLDFRVTVSGISKIIEFHGPSHFTSTAYSSIPEDPRIRGKKAEDDFGIEYIGWPYWIQRCAANVRAIFDPAARGLGVLWSTKILFGSFVFQNSADVIKELTLRFRADRGGFGYFYGPHTEGRNNPEHPVVEKISSKLQSASAIIPRGATREEEWLPYRLKI